MQTILQRISAGDRDAIEACLDEYGPLIWSLSLRYLGAHADAEDATQEIFLSLWSSAHRFDPSKGSEPSFVATIAHRRLIDIKRSARVRRAAPLSVAPEPASAAGRSRWGQDADEAAAALEALPDDERHAMQLAIRYGLSHAQIAAVTSEPIGTIKSRLRRGMKRLRERVLSPLVASTQGGDA